jgi:hypothetical protein
VIELRQMLKHERDRRCSLETEVETYRQSLDKVRDTTRTRKQYPCLDADLLHKLLRSTSKNLA